MRAIIASEDATRRTTRHILLHIYTTQAIQHTPQDTWRRREAGGIDERGDGYLAHYNTPLGVYHTLYSTHTPTYSHHNILSSHETLPLEGFIFLGGTQMKSPKKTEFLFPLETPPPKGVVCQGGGLFLRALHLEPTRLDDPPGGGGFLPSTLQDTRRWRGTEGITELSDK